MTFRCCLCAFFPPQKESKTTKANFKKQQEHAEKRSDFCLRKKSIIKNIHIIGRDRRALLLLLSLTLLSTPPILFIVGISIHGSGEVFHLGVVCLGWEQE